MRSRSSLFANRLTYVSSPYGNPVVADRRMACNGAHFQRAMHFFGPAAFTRFRIQSKFFEDQQPIDKGIGLAQAVVAITAPRIILRAFGDDPFFSPFVCSLFPDAIPLSSSKRRPKNAADPGCCSAGGVQRH